MSRHDPVEQWKETFAAGIVAAAGAGHAPWIDGCVHVVRDLPDQPDPVPTGGLDSHQLIVPLTPFHVTEYVPGGAPFWDHGWTPGEVSVYSRGLALADARTAWRGLRGERFGIVNLLVSPSAVAATARAVGLDYASTEFHDRNPVADPVLDALVRRLGAEAERGGPSGRLYAETLVAAVAAHLVADYSEGRPHPGPSGPLDPVRLRRVLDLVETRLAEGRAADLALDDLARAAAYSTAHFARAFKATLGVAPYRYVLDRRVEQARDLLATGRVHVGEAARAAGFSDASHFTRAFKAHVGTTPSRFRRESRR